MFDMSRWMCAHCAPFSLGIQPKNSFQTCFLLSPSRDPNPCVSVCFFNTTYLSVRKERHGLVFSSPCYTIYTVGTICYIVYICVSARVCRQSVLSKSPWTWQPVFRFQIKSYCPRFMWTLFTRSVLLLSRFLGQYRLRGGGTRLVRGFVKFEPVCIFEKKPLWNNNNFNVVVDKWTVSLDRDS